MCPKRLYTVCLETVVLELKRADETGATCAVTSTHTAIILELLPKPEDETLGDSKFLGYFQLVLSETWLANESDISIPNFNCIVKKKRPNTTAGGVAIYQSSSDTVNIITPSMKCSVSQFDICGTLQSSVRDLCLAECVIDNGQKL
ncbi:hypothetical protein TNCV_1837391 [Trichonephila clavipes]|nr:hypothetical protein TNCV_1837391 [Trichonephila clavipes]